MDAKCEQTNEGFVVCCFICCRWTFERFRTVEECRRKDSVTYPQKYYLTVEDIDDEELENAVRSILESDIFEEQLIHAKEKPTTKGEDGLVEIKESTAGYHVIDSSMPYGEFLRRIQSNTGIPMKIIHSNMIEYNLKHPINAKLFNKTSLHNFISKFQEWLESSFVYDSPKERETIENSSMDEVVVFGKIPRSSMRVPLYYGGTTSPDFMYVLKKPSGEHIINFIVETKDVKKDSGLRDDEKMRIQSAKKFFETLIVFVNRNGYHLAN